MDQMRQQVEQNTPQTTGFTRDLQTLKTNASASADELRQFINSLKGRRPEDVLGSITGSGLVRATAQATAVTGVLLAAFTLGPYLLRPAGTGTTKAATSGPAPATAASAPVSAAQPASTATANPAATDGPSEANVQKAAQVMGLDETKAADPKVNPLEKNLDKLLDGVD